MNRLSFLKENLSDYKNVHEFMKSVFNNLGQIDKFPIVGKYYTFYYKPKEIGTVYDPYPIVAVFHVKDWGINGINFHWKKQKAYTWSEMKTPLYPISLNEVSELSSLQESFKPQINN